MLTERKKWEMNSAETDKVILMTNYVNSRAKEFSNLVKKFNIECYTYGMNLN
jgi:hypothetical protein